LFTNAIIILLAWTFVSGCQSGMIPASQRDLNKGDGVLHAKPGSRQKDDSGERLYRRKADVTIEDKGAGMENGSLFNPRDQGNHLFADRNIDLRGQEVNVIVTSLKLKKEPANPPAVGSGAKAPVDGAGDTKNAKPNPDELEKTLLAMAPHLDGGDKNPELITEFRMTVLRRTDEGDYLARFKRESVNEYEVNRLEVTARIPYQKTLPGEVLTTNDLLDVEFLDEHDAEVFERRSITWEDEYSLRMSGFSEAKSKAAQELDSRKRELEKVRQQLDVRVKNLTKERTQVVKERERVGKKEAELDQKFKEMNEVISRQKETIDDQNKQLQEAQSAKLQQEAAAVPQPSEESTGEISGKPLETKPGEPKGAANAK